MLIFFSFNVYVVCFIRVAVSACYYFNVPLIMFHCIVLIVHVNK